MIFHYVCTVCVNCHRHTHERTHAHTHRACRVFILAKSWVTVSFCGEVSFVVVFTCSLPVVVSAVPAPWHVHKVLCSHFIWCCSAPTSYRLHSSVLSWHVSINIRCSAGSRWGYSVRSPQLDYAAMHCIIWVVHIRYKTLHCSGLAKELTILYCASIFVYQ